MGLVMGVGAGVFLLAFLGILAVVVSVAASRTSYSRTIVLASFGFYAVVALILFLTPRGSEKEVSETGYNNLGIFRIAILATMSTAAVGGVGMVAADRLFSVQIARQIDFTKDVLRCR